jgi:hypothetical protein
MLKVLQDKSQQYIDFTLHLTLTFFKHNIFARFGTLMNARFIQQLKHTLSKELN